MKKNEKIAKGFFIGAICFYIVAAIIFLNKGSNSNTMWIMFLCLGSSWVVIGGSFANKQKNKDDNNFSNNQGE